MTLVRVFPWIVSFTLLWLVSRGYFQANREYRDIIRKNLEEVFRGNRNGREIDLLFKSTLKGIFCHYYEKLFLACTTNRQWKQYFLDRIRIVGKRRLDGFLSRNKGVILVTAHFGAVEFLPGYLALLGYRVAIVAKFRTQRLRDKCRQKAKCVGAIIIDAGEKNSLFLALSALGEGRILITECDEVDCWKAHPRETIPLFGTSFRLDRTVAILQKRSGAPAVFGHVRREGKGRYVAEIEDLEPRPSGLQGAILKRFEKLIRRYPDQWYVWKNFQLMKASGGEEIAVEDRDSRDIPITPAPSAVFQVSQSHPESYGQCCPQGSI